MARARSAPGRVATNTIARAAGEAVAKVASLAFYVVLARELGTHGYGSYVFALALTGTLLIGSGFGTDELVARQVAREHSRAGQYLANVVGLKAVTSIGLLAIAMAVVFIGHYGAEERLAVLVVGGGVAIEVLAKTWHAVFQGRERLALISACLILQRTLTAVIGISVLVSGGGLVAAAFVYLGCAVVGLAAAEYCYRRWTPSERPFPTREGGLTMLRGGFTIGLAGLLFVLLLKVDVLLLSFLDSNAEVGLYSAAYRLIEGSQFVPWAFDAAMLPWLARATGPTLRRGYLLGLKLQWSMLLPVGLIAACFAPLIITTLYGDEFKDAATPLALLGGTLALYGLQSFSSTLLIARDVPGLLARAAGITFVQNLICNCIAIPIWGADGAAAVALSSGMLMTVLTVSAASKRAGGLSVTRAFSGPVVAGAALVAVALLVPLPAIPAGALALIAYAGVLIAFEWSLHREDVLSYVNALPLRRPHAGPVE
jgi:O-antigen/teichoic acid export membrane protein